MTARLGFLTYGLDRSPTGIGRYTCGLRNALLQLNIDLTVLQAGKDDGSDDIINLPGASLLPGLLTLGQLEIGWIARQKGFDLVHDPTGVAPLSLTNTLRVVTICDVFPYVQPHTSTTLERLIYHHWLPRILPHIDAVITISQQSKNDIIQHLPISPEKVTLISLAANAIFRVLPPNDITTALEQHVAETPYILYVGSIEPRKNLLRLLKAYAHLREWSEQWHLVIVGARNIWKSTPVAEAVKKLGMQDCVHFTGYIPEEDLPALYNAADLFVFPSLYEGFGLPVLEAMACGTPVVTSNTSSLPEVAGDAALLVDPYDVEAIAAAMQRILSVSDLAADLRQRGLERAKQFTWEKTARETIKVYERVLGSDIVETS